MKRVSNSNLEGAVAAQASAFAGESDRPSEADGIKLTDLKREIGEAHVQYDTVTVEIDRRADRDHHRQGP